MKKVKKAVGIIKISQQLVWKAPLETTFSKPPTITVSKTSMMEQQYTSILTKRLAQKKNIIRKGEIKGLLTNL